jgi:hypothetical protein
MKTTVISKNWWIVREKKSLVVKKLTWKEMEQVKVATKLYWSEDKEATAHIYREYLITKHKENLE